MENSQLAAGSVILGCGTFGGIGGLRHLIGKGLDRETSLAVLDEAVSLGITDFDTAERYGGGESELVIGHWLSSRDPATTGRVRVRTKVSPPDASSPELRLDGPYIEARFEQSLARLGQERVEWLLVQAPHEGTPIEVTLEALEGLRSSGRVVHIGACNLDAQQLNAALDAADRLSIRGYELVQNGFSLADPDAGREVRELCSERGLAFTAFSPLAGGLLTGKYRRDQPPPPGSRLEVWPEEHAELLTPAMFDALDTLADVAERQGVLPGAVALAWLFKRSDVTAVVTGPARTEPHLTIARQASRLELTNEEIVQLLERFRAAHV